MAEAVARWLDGWPAGSPWRRYFTEDSERWSKERVCPECWEQVPAEDELTITVTVTIGVLKFAFHAACLPSFEFEAEERPIDWGQISIPDSC